MEKGAVRGVGAEGDGQGPAGGWVPHGARETPGQDESDSIDS